MNLSGRRFLNRQPLAGVWYRAVRPQFAAAALAHSHATTIPGRFNGGIRDRPGPAVLYLAEDHQVALFEVRALLGPGPAGPQVVPNPNAGPWTLLPVRVVLGGVIDLCDPEQLRLIDTSIQELTGDWEGYRYRPFPGPYPPLAPTQQLGAALFRMPRVEGFLTHSARVPTRRNLVLFPTKLRPNSAVEVTDPSTGQVLLRLP